MLARRSLLAALTVPAFAGPVAAHSELRASAPASGARLSQAPESVDLTFNEPVQVTALRLYGADGREIPVVRTRELRTTTRYSARLPALDPGGYRVEWRIMSADGHPVGGVIRFQVGATP